MTTHNGHYANGLGVAVDRRPTHRPRPEAPAEWFQAQAAELLAGLPPPRPKPAAPPPPAPKAPTYPDDYDGLTRIAARLDLIALLVDQLQKRGTR